MITNLKVNAEILVSFNCGCDVLVEVNVNRDNILIEDEIEVRVIELQNVCEEHKENEVVIRIEEIESLIKNIIEGLEDVELIEVLNSGILEIESCIEEVAYV